MPLTNQQLTAIRRSLERYAGEVSGRIVDDALNGIKGAVESLIKPGREMRNGVEVEVGFNPATARAAIAELAQKYSLAGLQDAGRIDFALTTARDVAQGAGTFAQEALDAEVVDEYPGWELLRVYDRAVPRGWRRGQGSGLMPVPGDDWPARWVAAGGELLAGRMVALKSDPVWQNLGDGVGGYDDTLGNPFPPFAFNSGFDVNNLDRAECEALGLLRPGQAVAPAAFDLTQLFAPLSEAA